MLKSPPASFSAHRNPQRGPGRLTDSAARTDVVLLIRRTVRPRGYASGFDSPAALLDGLFEQPAGEFLWCATPPPSARLGPFWRIGGKGGMGQEVCLGHAGLLQQTICLHPHRARHQETFDVS